MEFNYIITHTHQIIHFATIHDKLFYYFYNIEFLNRVFIPNANYHRNNFHLQKIFCHYHEEDSF